MAETLKLVVPGPGEASSFLLDGRDAVVGRDPGCDVVLENGTVSSRHGMFRPAGAGWTYADLASRNGSALVRGGVASPLPAGEIVLLSVGDELLLGAAESPSRLRVEVAGLPFAAAPGQRTIVATAPLAAPGAASRDAMVTLAASCLETRTPDGLARAALAYLKALVPGAAGRSVRLVGAGFTSTAGDEVPAALSGLADGVREVLLVDTGAAAGACVVAPLIAGGTWHGALFAWSPAGVAAVSPAALKPLAVAAPLVALASSSLAVAREGEEARRELEAELSRLRGGAAPEAGDPVGTNRTFLDAVTLCRSVAPTGVPVVLLGETGTGKEILARALHRWSRRAERPFVAFNCAAVPETLLESELFGHVRGAFTGAGADRRGLFEEADGGTLFLDEIGEMPLPLQAKLLRVLQDGEVRRVGANRVSRVDVRVVSATNQDLAERVAAGGFRADLLYRLNAVTVRIPPLRDRGDDRLLLAHHLLGQACRRLGRRVPGFSPEALAALVGHPFPGNIRELENEVLRGVALTPEGSPIRPDAFSEELRRAAPHELPAEAASAEDPAETSRTLRDAVETAERRTIEGALVRSGGNITQAARELGLTRPGLYKVMDRLGIRSSTPVDA